MLACINPYSTPGLRDVGTRPVRPRPSLSSQRTLCVLRSRYSQHPETPPRSGGRRVRRRPPPEGREQRVATCLPSLGTDVDNGGQRPAAVREEASGGPGSPSVQAQGVGGLRGESAHGSLRARQRDPCLPTSSPPGRRPAWTGVQRWRRRTAGKEHWVSVSGHLKGDCGPPSQLRHSLGWQERVAVICA